MEVRKIREDEIHKVQELVPNNWTVDLAALVKKYYLEPRFYPIVAAEENELLACGNLLMFGKSAWLGHILVKERHRRRGLGTIIVKTLIDYAKEHGIKSVNLTATKEGEYLYKTLGFKEDGEYYMYKGICRVIASPNIAPINKEDWASVIEMDDRVTAERREWLFDESVFAGYKYVDGKGAVKGFFLPHFGQGLVLAIDEEAGIELLKVKHLEEEAVTVVPSSNQAGISFLEQEGFTLIDRPKRMYLGTYTPWVPENVFSRGNAYSG